MPVCLIAIDVDVMFEHQLEWEPPMNVETEALVSTATDVNAEQNQEAPKNQ